MSRRKKRPANGAPPAKPAREPAFGPPPPSPPVPDRPNKWLLAASIAILIAWIGFLVFLAIGARRAGG